MGIIKKFRIKSFKKNKALVSLDKISLSFGKGEFWRMLVSILMKVKY